MMKSIYEQALGVNFARLHPEIQKKFSLTHESNMFTRCTGVMREIGVGSPLLRPFLRLGVHKHLTFVENGQDVPFTLENYAFLNAHGEQCVSWIRRFHFQKTRCFDAVMMLSPEGMHIVDWLGIDRDVVTDIHLEALPNGGIRLVSGPLVIVKKGWRIQLPSLFGGTAIAEEWYDEALERFQIRVQVKNRFFGTIFYYSGSFTMDVLTCPDGIPDYGLLKKRTNRSE
ncbi:MAG: DUF4166 domain-containing protein [Bacilli bacterium]